jgi:uncharacterized OB-fold protein
MALVQCKECGNEVAATAATCPKCEAPIPRGNSKAKKYAFMGERLVEERAAAEEP